MIKRFKRNLFKDIRRCMSVKSLYKENRKLRCVRSGLTKLLTHLTCMLADGCVSLSMASHMLETDEKTLKEWISFGHLPRIEGLGQFYLPSVVVFDLVTRKLDEKGQMKRSRPLTPGEAIDATKKYYEIIKKTPQEHAQD